MTSDIQMGDNSVVPRFVLPRLATGFHNIR